MGMLDEAKERKASTSRAAPKIWCYTVAENGQGAADFLNQDPAQGAGEAVISSRPDGQVDVWYYL